MCKRELDAELNCYILTPTLLAITVFLSRSPGLLNRGPVGPASLGHVPESIIFSTTGLISKLSRPLLPGAGVLYRILSPTGLISKLTDILSSPRYILVRRPLLVVGVKVALIQPIHGEGYNSDIPQPDAPVIYTGTFPILTARLGHRSIYNIKGHILWTAADKNPQGCKQTFA